MICGLTDSAAKPPAIDFWHDSDRFFPEPDPRPSRVIVFGSRNWGWGDYIRERIRALPAGTVIVHGGCHTGADRFAHVYAHELGFTVEVVPARWDLHGRAAGPFRNEGMAELGARLAIGFRSRGKSGGTDDMARAAIRHGIELERHGWEWRV